MLTDERISELWLSSTNQTFDWMRAFARAVEAEAQREALEQAAKICEGRFYVGDDCAAAIRALIEKDKA